MSFWAFLGWLRVRFVVWTKKKVSTFFNFARKKKTLSLWVTHTVTLLIDASDSVRFRAEPSCDLILPLSNPPTWRRRWWKNCWQRGQRGPTVARARLRRVQGSFSQTLGSPRVWVYVNLEKKGFFEKIWGIWGKFAGNLGGIWKKKGVFWKNWGIWWKFAGNFEGLKQTYKKKLRTLLKYHHICKNK